MATHSTRNIRGVQKMAQQKGHLVPVWMAVNGSLDSLWFAKLHHNLKLRFAPQCYRSLFVDIVSDWKCYQEVN